ncbi:iron ABC transporter permease [Bdellovibrionota bacterium FG-1]
MSGYLNALSWQWVLDATIRSLAISVVVALLSGFLGVVMAWVVTRTDAPGADILGGVLSVPYAIPAYLLGMAWVVLGNPQVGLLKAFFPSSGSYGFWGIVFVETSVAFAFPYLELKAGFERLDAAFEEAARMSGATPGRVFRDISLPLLWPSLLNGMILAFLYSLSAFGVPALLGLPVRQFTLTTLIYSQLKLGGGSGLVGGFALSLLLLCIAAVGLVLSSRVSRSKSLSGGKSSHQTRVKLGRWRAPVSAFGWGFFGIAVILPWIALALSALAPVAGRYSPRLWTLEHLGYVLKLQDFREALVNSLFLAGAVATLITFVGFSLGFLAVRRRQGWASVIIQALGLPFATPGTVLAMGVLFVAVVCARFGMPINEPLLMMAAAYGFKYAAVAARSLVTAFSQVDPVMEEAARVSGANTAELLWTIWLPLLRKTLLSAWWLGFLPMLTELTMSVLLTGPGAATLGTVLFELQEYADQPSAAALAWLLLTAALGVGLMSIKRGDWSFRKSAS